MADHLGADIEIPKTNDATVAHAQQEQAIQDVNRAAWTSQNADFKAEGEKIAVELAAFLQEMRENQELKPLPEDGLPDISAYNEELRGFAGLRWFDAPWLYSECYMYRRMQIPFIASKHWKSYDVFAETKIGTFRSSRTAVLELAAQYRSIVTEWETSKTLKHASTMEEKERAEEEVFKDMCEICLWGNATDLSLLTNLTNEGLEEVQGSKARKASEQNILVNQLPQAFAVLNEAKKQGKRERVVDFILDNAGFELFNDLILAGYLLSVGLATTVVLHPKVMPWFVSDVVPADFSNLLNALADPRSFYDTPSAQDKEAGRIPPPLSQTEVDNIRFLFDRWSTFHAEGQLVIRPNIFWTGAGPFWRLPKEVPDVFEDLKQSELVVFKGDLNYRKITGDVMWPPTTPFSVALGPLGVSSGLRVLSLRTCKGDAVVGLPEGKDEELKALAAGAGPYERWQKGLEDGGLEARRWAWSGKWAVIQFYDGKGNSFH